MTVSWMLLIAARSMASCANTRLKYVPGPRVIPHDVLGSVMHPLHMTQTPVRSPRLQMVVGTGGDDDDDDTPETFSSFPDHPMMMMPPRTWKGEIKGTRISRQAVPPTLVYGFDVRQILESWIDEFLDPFMDTIEEKVGAMSSPLAPAKIWQDDKAMVLHEMRDVLLEATSIYFGYNKQLSLTDRKSTASLLQRAKEVEIVGLIPKDFDVSHLESGSSAVELSVLALCVFSRKTLADDQSGSIRKVVEKHYGKRWTRNWWGRDKKKFDVFAVDGLAEAPLLPSMSSRILLAKIEKYAYKEQRIVHVPKWAYISSDETNLSEYYVELGFELVEMDEKLHELIYIPSLANPPETDMFVETQQIMVGMNVWADE